MSLINDALKKAKAAQQTGPAPAAANLQFRPVEPAAEDKGRDKLYLAFGVSVFAALTFVLVWWLAHSEESDLAGGKNLIVSARTAHPSPQLAPSEPVPSVAVLPPSVPVPTTATPTPGAIQSTNTVAVEPVIPKPPPLKLQAIFYNPKRPSAMINGKSLVAGDKIGEFRVLGIDQNSLTLGNSAVTNVLSLGD